MRDARSCRRSDRPGTRTGWTTAGSARCRSGRCPPGRTGSSTRPTTTASFTWISFSLIRVSTGSGDSHTHSLWYTSGSNRSMVTNYASFWSGLGKQTSSVGESYRSSTGSRISARTRGSATPPTDVAPPATRPARRGRPRGAARTAGWELLSLCELAPGHDGVPTAAVLPARTHVLAAARKIADGHLPPMLAEVGPAALGGLGLGLLLALELLPCTMQSNTLPGLGPAVLGRTCRAVGSVRIPVGATVTAWLGPG